MHPSPFPTPAASPGFKRKANNYNIFLRIYRNMCASAVAEGVTESSRHNVFTCFPLNIALPFHPSHDRSWRTLR